MPPDHYDPIDRQDQDPQTKGRECLNCGRPGYEHDLERVQEAPDRYSYDYICPDDS